MKLIQIFNRQQKKELEFLEKNENLRKSRYKVVLAFGIYRPFITLLYISSIAVTFWLGMEFGLDAGMIVAFYLYLSRFSTHTKPCRSAQQLAKGDNRVREVVQPA